jgi:aspartyl-tRNA(Asn)/glutamyl-tRNA(Gln) amidotransferase subunit B
MPARSEPVAGEAVVGLEVHAQLLVSTKLLCACPADGEATCEVCLGHPGTLPVLRDAAVRVGLIAVLAVDAEPAGVLAWARKHYAYRDLPRGYQVTQDSPPLGCDGRVALPDGRVVPIVRLHLEEDSGRTREVDGRVVVDDGRAGMALVEVVTAPVLGCGADAEAAMRAIHAALVGAGACGGAMERGQLRCDANVSLRDEAGVPGPRVELKNLNSFRYVRRAVDAEIQRQRAERAAGRAVAPHTRGWDGRATRPLRARLGHRWLEEVDLCGGPPRRPIPPGWVDDARVALASRVGGALRGGGAPLPQTLDAEEGLRAAAVDAGVEPSRVGAWLRDEWPRVRALRAGRALAAPGAGAALALVLARVTDGTLGREAARAVMVDLSGDGGDLDACLSRHGGAVDPGEVLAVVRATCEAHPGEVARYRGGERAILGFLVGRVMAATHRRANPAQVHGALRRVLGDGTTEGEGP